MSEIADQIDEMLKTYEDNEAADLPVIEDESANKDGQGEDDNAGEGTPVVSDAVTPVIEPIKETTPPVETELEKLRREQLELRQSMDEILNRPTTPTTPTPTIPEPVSVFEEQDFLGDADLDDIMSNTKEFNKLLNKVYKKGIEDAERRNTELRTALPETIRDNVLTLETLRKTSEKFYEDNKDLVPFKGAVATVFGELSTQHPNWQYEKLLNESEVETRKRLNLPKQTVVDTPVPAKDVPRLPNKVSQRRTTPEAKSTNPIFNEIDAMNAVLT